MKLRVPRLPQMIPAMARFLPERSAPTLATWLKPMTPKMTASQPDGGAGARLMIPENEEAGDAEAVGTTGGVEGGAFHGEGHAAGFAVVGGDGAGGGASTAADDLAAVGLTDDFWGAIAGGGVGVDGVGILFDDLAGFGIDQAAVAVEDGDGDLVAAGGALAVLCGHGFGGLETAGAVAAVEGGSAFPPEPAALEGGGGGGDAERWREGAGGSEDG